MNLTKSLIGKNYVIKLLFSGVLENGIGLSYGYEEYISILFAISLHNIPKIHNKIIDELIKLSKVKDIFTISNYKLLHNIINFMNIETLLKVIQLNDKDLNIHISTFGYEEISEVLCYSEYIGVKTSVAELNHLPSLEILVFDEDSFVRERVAMHYHPHLLNILKDDIDPFVRAVVATHGDKELCEFLKHDTDFLIQHEVKKYLDN